MEQAEKKWREEGEKEKERLKEFRKVSGGMRREREKDEEGAVGRQEEECAQRSGEEEGKDSGKRVEGEEGKIVKKRREKHETYENEMSEKR